MKIFSPMATGNGAYIVHQELSKRIEGYNLLGYNPYLTLFPPILPYACKAGPHDILHTAPDYGIFFHQKKVPLVITFHGFVFDEETLKYSTSLQRLHQKSDLRYFVKKSLEVSTKVVSVSNFVAKLIRSEFDYDKEIEVIHNGVDIDKFHPCPRRQGHKIKVLFCGNLTKRKGANLLPKIAAKLEPGIEIIYTQGLRTKYSLPQIENMRNIGSISYENMPSIYQQADILIFPTVREGFGLAVAEAMACGLPIVATDCSSLPELVVQNRGGYLCKIGAVDDFASKINELASSLSLRNEMGEFNRKRIEEQFTLTHMVEKYRDIFLNTIQDQI